MKKLSSLWSLLGVASRYVGTKNKAPALSQSKSFAFDHDVGRSLRRTKDATPNEGGALLTGRSRTRL